ncbi:PQQ-like beta-propeller repeat protein, partial [candidate division WOR-3 bacterium]|nr:PQQ-like beta-propeller repeat protein [candidate division WOR-3 bacterium]
MTEGNNFKPLILNNQWDTVWTRTYGENYDDKAYTVAVDSQGYYVVAGVSDDQQCPSPPCWWCIWLLKIDPLTGDTIWARKYFEYTGIEEAVNAISVDKDGYYVIAGYNVSDWGASRTDIYILKIDPSTGNTIWTRTYGGTERETAYDVAVDDSGYYVVAGWTESFGVSWRDYWVLKIDPVTGDTIWSRTYGGSNSDGAYAVTVDKNGHYVVVGCSQSLGASWVLKIDPSTGDTISTYLIPPCGPYGLYPTAWDITTGPDGYHYLTGEIPEDPTPMAKSEIWVGKLSPELDIIWNRIYGGSSYDYSYGIAMNKFGDCVVAGQTFTGFYYVGWVLKIKSTTGDTIWTKKYGEIAKLRDIVVDKLGYYFAAGYTQDPYYYYDYWIFKLVGDMDTLPPDVQVSFPNGGENFVVGDTCNITWAATDNVGVDSISIFYSINAGVSWDTITTGEPNDSLFKWTIPNTPSDNCLIKILAYDPSLNIGEDQSDSLFRISSGVGIEENIS